MKRALLAVALVLSLAAPALAAPRMTFVRDEWIWIADLDGTHARKLVRGDDPDLSPDGASVAFTMSGKAATRRGWTRRIAIADGTSGRTRVLKAVPGDNAYGPEWSHDGHTLLVNNWDGDGWQLAAIDTSGAGYRVVRRTSQHDALYEPCWGPETDRFWCHDLDSLYVIALADGAKLGAWSIAALAPGGGMSSASRLAASPDGRAVLMDVDMDEDVPGPPGWDGPPPALWRFDVASGSAERLTPHGVFAWDGCWADDSTIVYRSQGPHERVHSLWRVAAHAGATPVRVLSNAAGPSVTR